MPAPILTPDLPTNAAVTFEAEMTETAVATFPPLLKQDIVNCSFSSWYENFKQVTFKTEIIRLSQEFVEYLNADGIFLPDDGRVGQATVSEFDDGDEDATNFDDDSENVPNNTPHFPEVEEQIWQALSDFDGSIFPKLNWSSPRDAAFITATQSLRCTSPFDVFLLLKSSDFINHDLGHAFDDCADLDTPLEGSESGRVEYDLVLRKWHELQPSMEFRCFVREGEFICCCQRDMNYYEFLGDMREVIEDKILGFFEDHVEAKFPSRNYVFDVYISRNLRKVWLVDFNPFGPKTDSLLFDWEEILAAIPTDAPLLRLIESQVEANMRSRSGPAFSFNMMPKDLVDMGSGRTITEVAEQFRQMMAMARQDESSDEESSESRGP